jgi:hypothetical protein
MRTKFDRMAGRITFAPAHAIPVRHLNRFGRNALNRDRVPEPLDSVREFRMPPSGEKSRRSAQAAV